MTDRNVFAYRALTVFGRTFQLVQLTCDLVTVWHAHTCLSAPTTPTAQRRGPITHNRFWLFPFRSPLLRESRLISIPRVTEMFQFSRCPRPTYFGLRLQSDVTGHYPRRVSPFGYLRIKACSRLPVAFRSLLRPSSALGAKAFAIRP